MAGVNVYLGIDPGPTTGLAMAYWDGDSWAYPGAYQCDAGSAVALLGWMLAANRLLPVRAQVEEFRAGTGAGARGTAASVTRTLVDKLVTVLRESGAAHHVRPAATAKPWSTDKRLERAGLLACCHGMPHAADAFRHLLFCAVHDGGVPDPLSKTAGGGYRLRAVPDQLGRN